MQLESMKLSLNSGVWSLSAQAILSQRQRLVLFSPTKPIEETSGWLDLASHLVSEKLQDRPESVSRPAIDNLCK